MATRSAMTPRITPTIIYSTVSTRPYKIEASALHTGIIDVFLGPIEDPAWEVGSSFGPLFPPGGPESLGNCRRTNASGRCIAMRKRA
jgi:hypothetical protein